MTGWLSRDGCGTGRLLSHLLGHFPFHFLCRRFSLVCAYHPSVSIGVDYMPQRSHQNMSKSLLIKGYGRLYVDLRQVPTDTAP